MHASLKLAMNFIKALPGSTRLKIKPIRLHGIIAFLNTWIKRHMMHAQPPLCLSSVGIALIGSPDILVLDEPTSGMDYKGRKQTLELLQQRKEEGCTILITTHNMLVLLKCKT